MLLTSTIKVTMLLGAVHILCHMSYMLGVGGGGDQSMTHYDREGLGYDQL